MRRAALFLVVLTMGAGSLACRRAQRDPFVTYLNGEFRLSIQYPASWRSEQASQEGVWYRYFLGPTTGVGRKSAISATLLAGPLAGSVDQYAQAYLAGNTVSATREERRPGLSGKSYVFATPEGATRYALLLLKQDAPPAEGAALVFGLYCQGEAASFSRYATVLDEMAASLTLERVQDWPEVRIPDGSVSFRLPKSWRHLRRTSGGGVRLEQFSSPALGVDKDAQTVHASLTLSIETASGGLDAYYGTVRRKLGPNFARASHERWKDGYVDLLDVETPMASSRIKRFYRVSGTKGYSLAFEARDDAYQRAAVWFDLIADTLQVGTETSAR